MYSLGIDIGSSSIKFVLVNSNFSIIKSSYILHKGRVKEEVDKYIRKSIDEYGDKIALGAVTGQGSKFIAEKYKITWINEVTSLVEGSKYINPNINSIVEIGGQSSKYITNVCNADNSNIKISINSNCSAGTGSFIEEQVSRLAINLEDFSGLTETANYVPRIAGRCSVFAKTDIIHHQQEGVEVNNILLGLAYALVKNYRANVVKKNPIKTPILLAGGVAYNRAIVKSIKDVLKLKDEEVIIPDYCANVSALGAAIIGVKEKLDFNLNSLSTILEDEREFLIPEEVAVFPALLQFGSNDSINKHRCKVIDENHPVSGYIGLDIGSTSTNVVFMDQENNVISFKYLRTLGDPIAAVTKGLLEIKKEIGRNINVLGVGATGSGRYMAGEFVGADVIVDEITAQAKAAYTLDNEVDTIIEIGGQDSKFIKLENGVVSDFEMNKICAAGTGSFIEEQAIKLKIPIEEFGELAMNSSRPIDLGDRCTVFIETNIATSISNDARIEDIAAGLSYSIVKNYLNRVVGSKEIGNKVFFQGGVANNQAVINAFRSVIGNKLEVPEFFSVTGAYGAAIIAHSEMSNTTSSFKGFDLDETTKMELLEHRELTKESKRTKIFEEIESYYLDGYEHKFDSTKKSIGIPRVLFLHKLFPLFNTFFKELGFTVVLSDNSSEKTVELSQEFSMDETCYPVKLINGHVAELLEKNVDYIFLPSLYTMSHAVSTTRQDYGCVYMQCVPKLINKTMELESRGVELLSPELSFKFGKKYMMKTIIKLGKQLGKNSIQTAMALTKGMRSLKEFESKVERQGEEIIKSLDKEEKAFVIVTRGYGIVDPILNMGIPEKLEKLGYKVLTLSNLPAHDHDTSNEHPNMYWPFGQHILSGAQIIRQHPNLYAIYITNHGCGPDTALNHYFKEEMKGKPYLNIEVDEHFSSVGVLTRVEAFVNSLKSEKFHKGETLTLKQYSDMAIHKQTNIKSSFKEIDKSLVLYLPYLYPYSQILAKYLQVKGYNAQVLPETTNKTINLGRKYTLSKEYLSFTGILGDVLNKGLEISNSKEKYGFIVPTSEGSEVGGQYHRLLRDKLNNENLEAAQIFAPYIEDIIKDRTISEDIFLMLIGGDLINLVPRNKRKMYLEKINGVIESDQLSIEKLKDMAQEIKMLLIKNNNPRICATGEINVLFNDFMNNNTFKTLEDKVIQVLYAPLSEYMWFVWKDFLLQEKNKKHNIAHGELTRFTSYLKSISDILKPFNIFEVDLENLIKRADQGLGYYSGGNGRYRYSKILGDLDFTKGIITVSSMYENTNTILNLLYQESGVSVTKPILNMTFDGNSNEIDNSKIDSFIYYALQENNVVELKDKREGFG